MNPTKPGIRLTIAPDLSQKLRVNSRRIIGSIRQVRGMPEAFGAANQIPTSVQLDISHLHPDRSIVSVILSRSIEQPQSGASLIIDNPASHGQWHGINPAGRHPPFWNVVGQDSSPIDP